MITGRGRLNCRAKTCPIVSLSTTYLSRDVLELNASSSARSRRLTAYRSIASSRYHSNMFLKTCPYRKVPKFESDFSFELRVNCLSGDALLRGLFFLAIVLIKIHLFNRINSSGYTQLD
jgi:hypothetical protein